MNLTPEQLAQLADDGDVLKLDDGRMLRLRIEVDQDFSINDYDGDGKTEQHAHSYSEDRPQRPAGFTGNAEKIQVDRGYWMWWEPPADGPKRGTPEFIAERARVRDLLECGFKGVVLELCVGIDAYGRPIVVGSESLWAIDSLDNGYLAEVVSELAEEIDA